MGVPMAARLAAAGFALRTFDLKGTGTCGSAREAAEGADALVTMLPDGNAVREAVLDALPALRRGAIVIDMSSSDPLGTRALGAALEAAGIGMVDAPVSGAVAGARDATLTIMAGGRKPHFEKSLPVLKAMGDRIFHVGPLGVEGAQAVAGGRQVGRHGRSHDAQPDEGYFSD